MWRDPLRWWYGYHEPEPDPLWEWILVAAAAIVVLAAACALADVVMAGRVWPSTAALGLQLDF